MRETRAEAETAGTGCPLLVPTRARGELPIGVYGRLPDGRVRVPPPEDLRRFCIPNRPEHCPVYARHVGAR